MPPTSAKSETPDLAAGIAYWEALPPTLDTVLGGLAASSLPLVDALSSRQLLFAEFPELHTFPTPHHPFNPPPVLPTPESRALEVGAGIGRVTSNVLLYMFTYVDMVEPVESFLRTAIAESSSWKGIKEERKGVRFIKAPLQDTTLFSVPSSGDARVLASVGKNPPEDQIGYDAIWCQWCLGHLSTKDLVTFLQQAKRSLRTMGCIFIKENVCANEEDGSAREVYDAQDSTVTRSGSSWMRAFVSAGLMLIRDEEQLGFAADLYDVRMYVLQ
ncbi:DUF858-domain-containing protein [Dacryopinax primogenitus]|uniref:Alpha N-terminal protein methyltransferase 1 n=1 Tax=Dacryopinax primogenitus (strain DJM 731) TaxID=1858805 RepID=M5GB29_DACPD|nr:DUF858-domain-containing protein [Dacryopinax primogenitus]EJU05600.1 DUF858-domain-containing protein [Dacryopinax primogenitus]